MRNVTVKVTPGSELVGELLFPPYQNIIDLDLAVPDSITREDILFYAAAVAEAATTLLVALIRDKRRAGERAVQREDMIRNLMVKVLEGTLGDDKTEPPEGEDGSEPEDGEGDPS